MAKGDHERGERRIDEQMKQSQSYLTGLQNQLGNQYGGLSNMYTGGGFPQTGNIYGWGTTVPNYSQYGPIFSGNNTDRPVFNQGPIQAGYGQSEGARANSGMNYQGVFNQLFPGESLSSDQLWAARDQLGQQGIEVLTNAKGVHGKVRLPDGRIVDVIGGADSGLNRKQWYDAPAGGGTGGGGGYGIGMSPGMGGILGRNLGDYSNIMGRFGSFADTGGLSDADKANIRARAVSPIRSIYSSARQGLDRQRALQGGYSPGFSTANARMAREQGQLASDATTNAEAAIAEMVQKGKLAGMGGMASMYGATPGLSNMFGNQVMGSMGQQLQAAGLQNALSMGIMNNQLGLAAVPGNFDSFINSVGGAGRAAGQVGGAIYPWLN